ncbi:DUF4279 domain-containing protein [Streptomyces polyrhachis]|uniref:DUF4279 domain-containing protein n=1 Tax=Streptomyces polyrhachis TaxID=1282885 RepID=A0ABW2GLD6_9ACTN
MQQPMTNPPMPDTKWSAGSLRIVSQTITVDEISAVLGIEPDDYFEHGSLEIACNPDTFRRKRSVWILKSGLDSDRWLQEHAEALVGRLGERRESLGRLAESCELELFLGFGSENGQGGCVLPARLLTEIGSLGLNVVLDLYPPDDIAQLDE